MSFSSCASTCNGASGRPRAVDLKAVKSIRDEGLSPGAVVARIDLTALRPTARGNADAPCQAEEDGDDHHLPDGARGEERDGHPLGSFIGAVGADSVWPLKQARFFDHDLLRILRVTLRILREYSENTLRILGVTLRIPRVRL